MKQTRWILVAILVLAAVFALAACDEGVTPPVDEACEHAYESTVTAEPTCTKEGTTTYTCSKCQDSYTEAIAATGKHTYTETVTAPTCTAEGYTTYTCACGETYRDNTVAATGHTYTDTVVAPTCSAEGYTNHTCACGDSYKDTTIAATGVHSYTEKVTAPTCTAEGYTTYTCACGKSYKDNTVAATGHDYTEKVTEEATCSKEGKATYTCSKCNDSYTAATAKKEHAYAAFTAHAPTCDTEGEEQTKCEICGDVYHTKVLEATGHSYTSSVTAPTCLADGYTTHTCSACGDSYRDNMIAASKEYHTFAPTVLPLTEEEAAQNPDAIGIATVACAVCGEAEPNADKKAVLVNVTFDGDIDLATYEGSEAYQTAMAGGMKSEAQKKAVAMLDAQKNLDLRSTGYGLVLTEDGKAQMNGSPAQFINTLSLGSTACTIPVYCISFDVTVNAVPSASVSEKDFPAFFSIHDNVSYGNHRPIKLALSNVDLDPAEEVATYELYAQSINGGYKKQSEGTGYYITLGKQYSFKVSVVSTNGVNVYALFVKAEGETAYTEVGAYVFTPYTRDPNVSFICFDYSSVSKGNVIDNFMITTTPAGTTCTEHDYAVAVSKAPTCAAEGEGLYVCLACGDSYTDAIPKLTEHTYEATVTAPTCTVDGYTTHTCSVCGDSYTDSTVTAKGHSYTRTEFPANCVDGYYEYTCACGDKYTEPSGQLGTGAHDWAQTSTVAPTCGTAGYFVETCNNCGNTRNVDDPASPATGLHTYQTTIRELTEAEAAKNPDAIGIKGTYCTLCGMADPSVTEEAILVNVTFDEDIDLATFEGSQAYKDALAGDKMKTDAQKKAVAMLDGQKNLDLRTIGYGLSLTADGRAVIGKGANNQMVAFNNTLSLGASTCTIPAYTISFDITVNAVPSSTATNAKDFPAFFSIHSDTSYGNNRPIMLVLSGTDLDTNPDDDVHTYQLYTQSRLSGSIKSGSATGYNITIGQKYSFKLDVASANGENTFTVFAKTGAETEYTKVGTYKFSPDTKSPYVTFICFNYYQVGAGNVIDNLYISAPVVK